MLKGDATKRPSAAPDDRLRALPKAELHVHLDGSLRPATMAELARERGVALPTYDPEALGTHMLVSDAHSLEEYLSRFVLTLSVMQDAASLERIAYELAADHAEENVRYVEVRFCPALNTRGGLSSHEVMDATLAGLERAERAFPIRTRVIVCALRTLEPAISVEMAELAVAYRDRGAVAFDLAGAEAGNPVQDHLAAFDVARQAGLPRTVHAGEGFGAPSIHQAVHLAGAARIGHGTRLFEDPELEDWIRGHEIPLEVCVTSNVQTGVAPTYRQHPVRRYRDEGIPVVLCTDNRLMSGVSVTDEYAHARDYLGFTWDDLVQVARTGFQSAFVDDAEKSELLAAFEAEAADLS
ncbi:MAG TPA: adenosine deaminase [Longimicrobiales bacterium]|nr:adenosine deaminase [Longimicrobiales bacterium]